MVSVLVSAFAACDQDDGDDDAAPIVTTTMTSENDDEDPVVDNTTPSQGIVELEAALAGSKEIGHEGDRDGEGTASVAVDVNNREICFTLTVSGLDSVTGAHIHRGSATENGAIVVPLQAPTNGRAEGCVRDVDIPLATTIAGNPSGYYVNVHTEDHPDGAVRGQLEAG